VFNWLPNWLHHTLNRFASLLPEGMKGKSFLLRGTTALQDRYIGNAKIFEEQEKRILLKNYNNEIPYQTVTSPFYQQVAHDLEVNQMQYIDIHTWLPGDVLFKAETMANIHSLQICMPFLDKKVFEVAKTLPVHKKITKQTTK